MSQQELEDYISWLLNFKNNIQSQNATGVSNSLSFMEYINELEKVPDYSTAVERLYPKQVFDSTEPKLKGKAVYTQIVTAYIHLISCLKNTNIMGAIENSMEMINSFVKCAQYETTWICVPLITVSTELRKLVFTYIETVNIEDTKTDKSSLPLDEKLIATLQKPFKVCHTDKSGSKKIAVYFFANELFKCYFKFQKYEAASNLAKVLSKDMNLPPVEDAPKSHSVNYNYYTSLIACMNDDLSLAGNLLTTALTNCLNVGKISTNVHLSGAIRCFEGWRFTKL
ncbi:unnamed protein product [Ambrosiozyma monospora]|uniref:Unnamed protein product n=1 Tax=Ambrosiozyma monospora TaxID=43982 RepID=A0A9W6Z651_AMBMO|nr:unnamed protein product [Ambrosiozyma monospora]